MCLWAFLSVFFFISGDAFAWDLSSVDSIFTSAESEIKTVVLAILVTLVVVWVGRKFAKITNRS